MTGRNDNIGESCSIARARWCARELRYEGDRAEDVCASGCGFGSLAAETNETSR
jgi:hypothetical protein